ncbi:MAG TPA: XkdF-like putative serine protease domain-containing protein, partial [Kofleriaceae bacterium]|nr:XkdF-like putative serine protease domain-containing protein [Kofleriaceae bacterium]
MAQRYRLKLNRLDFVSPVDQPAQETAKVLLLKRRAKVDSFARVVKTADDLGLVFCWAFTSTDASGQPYHDLQGDAIDQDFVKAAADFMLDGGRTDEMHDGQADGRVVFAMPMTPEIAKAFGVVTKTTGLMVALKPSPDVYAKFKSGEYTGVSIAGIGTRELAKRRVAKEAVMTSNVDGHQHVIDLDDPATSWCSMYSTSYQTSEGADNGHSHAWTFDATSGAIAIGADSGHTHTIAAVVPPDVLAAYAALDAAQDAENAETAATPTEILAEQSDGVCAPVTDEESSGKVSVVVVQARAPQNKSTPRSAMPHGALNTEKSQMDKDKQIADLTTKTAELEKRAGALSKMSAVAFAVFKSLTGQDADAFLAKSSAEQDAAA